MHAAGKILGNVCLKTIRDTLICDLWSGKWQGVLVGVISNRSGGSSNFWDCRETPPQFPALGGTSWSPHKENSEEGFWSTYCNDFEKSEWEYSFKATNLQHVKSKMKKR